MIFGTGIYMPRFLFVPPFVDGRREKESARGFSTPTYPKILAFDRQRGGGGERGKKQEKKTNAMKRHKDERRKRENSTQSIPNSAQWKEKENNREITKVF